MRSSKVVGLALALAACKGDETDTAFIDTEETQDTDAFAIVSFAMTPQGVAAGEPISAAFSAPGAQSCTVAFNGPLPDHTLTTGELASGSFETTLDASTIAALIEAAATSPAQALFASLTCAGPTGSDTAFAAVEVVRDVGVRLSVDPLAVPSATGGDITLCWTATEGTCRVYRDDGAELGAGLPVTGCLDPFALDATHGYFVDCCVGDVCEGASVTASRGPAITSFAVAPRVLPAPGPVTASWDAFEMASCTLHYDDAAVGTGASGTVEIAAHAGTSAVWIECLDADGAAYTGSSDVIVGATLARFDLLQINAGEVFARWTTHNADTCALELTSPAGTETFGPLPPSSPHQELWYDDYAPFNFASPDEVFDVAFRCEGLADAVETTQRRSELLPVRLVNAWITPATAPTTGGTVDLCWQTEAAESCYLYRDDDAHAVPTSGCEALPLEASDSTMRQLWCTAGESRLSYEFWTHAGPGNEIHAEPRYLDEAGPVTLTWSSIEQTDCAVEDADGNVLSLDASGELTVAVTEDTTYAVTCTGPEGEQTSEVDVHVGPRIDGFSVHPTPELDRLEVSWETHGMEGCEIELDNGHDQLLLDDVAPYSASYALPHPAYTPLRLHTLLDGAGDSTVSLRCDGPKGAGSRTIVVPEPEFVTIESFEVTPSDLPVGGGLVDVCWSATGATTCQVASSWTPDPANVWQFTAGPEGCISDVDVNGAPMPLTESTSVWLDCSSAIDSKQAEQIVLVGPSVRSFAAAPAMIASAGTVRLSWDAVQMASCEVRDADGVVATGVANEGLDVAVDATTTFTLACIGSDASLIEQALTVGVGADILALSAFAQGPNSVVVRMQSTPFVDDCALYLDRADGFRTSPFGVYAGGFPEDVTNTLQWDFGADGPVTVSLVCHAGTEVLRRSVAVPVPAGPFQPTITSFTVTPELSLTGPAVVQACWEASEADDCAVATWVSGEFFGLPATGCQDFTIADDDYFQVICSNEFGQRVVGKWARIAPAVTSLVATPAQVFLDEGATTTLSWESTGMATCELVSPDGSRVAVTIDDTYEVTLAAPGAYSYGLECLDDTGTGHASYVTVDVFSER